MVSRGLARSDLIVIVLVLAVLLMLLIPYVLRQRMQQRRLRCEERQRTIAQALLRYEGLQGEFPGYRNLQAVDAQGQRRPTGWVFPVLPRFLEPEPGQAGPWADVYARYGPPGEDAMRGQTPQVYIAELVCPENPPDDLQQQPNWMSWVVNSGKPDAEPTEPFPPDWPANGVFLDLFTTTPAELPRVSLEYLEDHDGAANTLLLSENVDSGQWTDHQQALVGFVWVANLVEGQPDPGERLYRINRRRGQGDGSLRFARPSSYHPGGVNVVFCDGRTQFLSQDIDYLAFTYLMTPDGQNVKVPGQDRFLDPPFRIVPASIQSLPE